MSERLSRSPSTSHLEPPRKSVELEDPGAQGSGTADDIGLPYPLHPELLGY